MSNTDDPSTENLGTDGTIPNSPDGIAVGHDPDGSHFNPEEDDTTDTDTLADDAGHDAANTSPRSPRNL